MIMPQQPAQPPAQPPPPPELPGAFAVGDVIADRYRITEHLGDGAFSHVYKATHTRVKALHFAIKVLRKKHANSDGVVERFHAEAETLSKLPSNQVLKAVDFGECKQGLPYIVMELAPGETLEHVLRGLGPLPQSIVARLAHQLLTVLESCHRLGIVHRDIKPSNVHVCVPPGTDSLTAYLLDFGIATNPATPEANIISLDYCTPQYSAPEVSEAISNPAVDIYSVGVLMSEMLSGELPDELCSRTPEDLHKANLTKRHIPFTRSVEESALYPLILKATQPEPELRFETAAAMREALEAVTDAFIGEASVTMGETELVASLGDVPFESRLMRFVDECEAKKQVKTATDDAEAPTFNLNHRNDATFRSTDIGQPVPSIIDPDDDPSISDS